MSRFVQVIAIVVGGMLFRTLPMAAPGELFAGETEPALGQSSAPVGEFTLTAQEGRLSLRAENASLKAIVEEIGRQMSIEVMARIPADEGVTLTFEQLPLKAALTRLSPYVNYAVVEDVAKGPGAIRKLLVVSKRLAGAPSSPTGKDVKGWTAPPPSGRIPPQETSPARPKAFSFEFDPSAVPEKDR
jgi:hypothetical protein